nr:immunoglobulin heavy chain junction region [Macaca mulatta]MOX63809.1 immunoglobulin heavy chain junction region [Macaca mulatta]MOX65659.1 immunoglobulin heavy chain junction region [Macaca mulatta]MOX66414.1 immunoglobulin heavy chain junction region [Macaca mulatta]MOX66679.1 immunoglobulin heavy chain junction region [Macaca mulatta]
CARVSGYSSLYFYTFESW